MFNDCDGVEGSFVLFRFSKCLDKFLCTAIGCGVLLLSACDNKQVQQLTLPKTPVAVCKKVTSTLLGITLPAESKVMEQEIHGERIVVHLNFQRAANDPMQSICVYGFDRYNAEGKQQLYRKVPTRMAVNDKQISEGDLLAALKEIGFEM